MPILILSVPTNLFICLHFGVVTGQLFSQIHFGELCSDNLPIFSLYFVADDRCAPSSVAKSVAAGRAIDQACSQRNEFHILGMVGGLLHTAGAVGHVHVWGELLLFDFLWHSTMPGHDDLRVIRETKAATLTTSMLMVTAHHPFRPGKRLYQPSRFLCQPQHLGGAHWLPYVYMCIERMLL